MMKIIRKRSELFRCKAENKLEIEIRMLEISAPVKVIVATHFQNAVAIINALKQ